MSPGPATTRVRLKPQDSFDLIRLLARSQNDPRKAVGELVQNSLDAGARGVAITWFTDKGARALRVWDDGAGIFPELDREEALQRIAQTIGHSHKRDLSPAQRRELMLIGKYGIGLLGFWSVGSVMEIRSRVHGGEPLCLRLAEDEPHGELHKPRSRRLDETATYTQITILGVHEAAARQVRPSRLQAYLASELRGQLLGREVEVTIHDRVARGLALKEYRVRAQAFVGRRLEEFAALAVPGHEDARLELYLVAPEEERSGRVALSCGGSTVLDDLAFVDGADAPRAPWSSGRLEGVLDFPELEVAPGTRRGFVPNAAANAFLDALRSLEEQLIGRVHEDDQRRAEERERELARDIRRAFLLVARALPEYDLFDVRAGRNAETGAPDGAGLESSAPAAEGGTTPSVPGSVDESEDSDSFLFPAGPLAAVRLVPPSLRLAPGATRRLRAHASDENGRAAGDDVALQWELLGPGQLTPNGSQAQYAAPAEPGQATVRVLARQGDIVASAEARISVEEELAGRERVAGIPEPTPVLAPAENWRSRMRDGRWEYNRGHRDYLAVMDAEQRRLRYLVQLFAKEIVLRNFSGAAPSELLERMVEVLTRVEAGPARAPSRRP